MPVQDTSGATQNYIGAANRMGNLALQNKERLFDAAGSAGGITKTLREAQIKEQMKKQLAAAGLDPAIAEAGPAAVAQAFLQKRSDDAASARQASSQAFQTERDTAHQRMEVGRENREKQYDTELGKQYGELTAPVMDSVASPTPDLFPPMMVSRAPTGAEMDERMRTGGFGLKVRRAASGESQNALANQMEERRVRVAESEAARRANEPVPIDPLSEQGVSARTKLFDQTEGKMPSPARNIDPNSPEGLAARKELAQFEANLKKEVAAAENAGKWSESDKKELEVLLAKIGDALTSDQKQAAKEALDFVRSRRTGQGGAHPSGASPDKVKKLEDAGYRWDGQGWVK